MATDAFNKVNGTENIYAIGDTCIQLTDGGFPNGHPQLASCDSARLNLAKNFKLTRKDKALIPFKYNDKDRWRL
jgi:NADH dehydrogenase